MKHISASVRSTFVCLTIVWTLILNLILPPAYCQIPGGIPAAASSTVMVDSAGLVIVPTNFFTANSNRITAVAGSGASAISGMVNLIPANAKITTGIGPLGDNGYQLPFNLTNGTVYLVLPDTNSSGGSYLQDNGGSLSLPGAPVPYFYFTNDNTISQPMFVIDGAGSATNNQPVTLKLFALTANQIASNLVAGMFVGNFVGTVPLGSTVADGALSQNVVFNNNNVNIVSTNNFHAMNLFCDNSIPAGDGTTFGLWKHGRSGYADIGFWIANQNGAHPAIGDAQGYDLSGALGCGVKGTNQFPYNEPYWENYNQHSLWFVQFGPGIFGGVNGTNGDFVWYQTKTSDAAETGKLMEVVRATTNVTIFGSLVLSNGYPAPSAATLGANKSVGLWVSNGVLYARTSANGTAVTDKLLAP